MKSSAPIVLCLLTFSHLVGSATSFQQRNFLAKNSRTFRPIFFWEQSQQSKFHQRYQQHSSPTCLFGGRQWHEKYQVLAEFHKKHGHLGVDSGGSLYQWIQRQRRKRRGVIGAGYAPLTDEQIQLLDAIGFDWNPKRGRNGSKVNDQWRRKYEKLAEFYKKNGNLRVDQGSSLYQWIIIQRRKHNGNEGYAALTDQQIQLLDDIGFVWNPKMGVSAESSEEKWLAKYNELAEFHKKHGHVRVKQGTLMYIWLSNQRKRRRGTKGYAPLTEQQIELLNQLDIDWNPKHTGRPKEPNLWNIRYQDLADFYQKHGDLKVDYQGTLYQWMCIQRKRRRGMKGQEPLTEEQIQLLDDIDFDWNAKQGLTYESQNEKWNAKYQELAEFYKEHGHLKVTRPSSLYRWMNTQRTKRRGCVSGYTPLTEKQIKLLDDIGFSWNPRSRSSQRPD